MPLTSNDRQNTTEQWIRKMFVEANATANFDTDTLRAVVNAVDDWADANAASFNSALPAGFRTSATAAQKALVLAYVAMKRGGVI